MSNTVITTTVQSHMYLWDFWSVLSKRAALAATDLTKKPNCSMCTDLDPQSAERKDTPNPAQTALSARKCSSGAWNQYLMEEASPAVPVLPVWHQASSPF